MSDIKKTVEVDVVVNGENQLDSLSKNLNKVDDGLKNVSSATDKHTGSVNNSTKSIRENGGAMGLLSAATGGLAMDFKDGIEAVEGLGVSMKGLRGAIIATGIGALAIVVLELVTNWEKWSGVIDGSTSSVEKLNEQLDIQKNLLDDLVYSQETQIALMKAKGIVEEQIWEVEKANLKERQNLLADQILVQKQVLQEAVASYNYWNSISKGVLGDKDKVKQAAADLKALEDEMGKLNDQFTIKSVQRETNARVQNEKTTKSIKEAVVQRVKAIGEEVEAIDLLGDARNRINKIKLGLEVPVEEDPIAKLKAQYEEEKKLFIDNGESILQLTAKYELDLFALKQESSKKRKDADDEAAKLKAEEDEQRQREQIEIFAGTLDDFAEALGEGTREQLAISEAAFQIRKIMADGEISTIEAVQATLAVGAKALGEHTALGKAAGVANATIKTYESATNAFNSLSGIPIVGPALGAAAAGIAVASGIANVKKILSVKIPNGGGAGGNGGGSVPTATSIPQAQFNVVGQSSNNQLARTISEQQNQPVQAYVVGSEITTQQSLDRNRVQNSTFL